MLFYQKNKMKEVNPFSLLGKKILVTGASSGIGKSIAIACAGMGANLYITARSKKKLNITLEEMLEEGEHKAIIADLTKQEDIERLCQSLPKLDGIVHCAGVGSRVLCKNLTEADLKEVFLPNVEAPILLQSSLLLRKKINKEASIVFIASRAARIPSMGNAAYSATKGAILSYARCLALELAPQLIRVNSVCPAMIWTDLILQEGVERETLEEAEKKYPLKRYGYPKDVAYLVLYLLSDASSWMTGSAVDLTGGAIEL